MNSDLKNYGWTFVCIGMAFLILAAVSDKPLIERKSTVEKVDELHKAHEVIADLLICFDDGVGEPWNQKQLEEARKFCNETVLIERAKLKALGR